MLTMAVMSLLALFSYDNAMSRWKSVGTRTCACTKAPANITCWSSARDKQLCDFSQRVSCLMRPLHIIKTGNDKRKESERRKHTDFSSLIIGVLFNEQRTNVHLSCCRLQSAPVVSLQTRRISAQRPISYSWPDKTPVG